MATQDNFTKYFKKRRIQLGYTTRKFAEAKGYDAGYISRLENGIIAPPSDQKKVAALAEALEIEKDSSEWINFLDLVALARSEVPEDIRNNEVALKVLPAFYRGIRNKTLNKAEVDKLLDLFKQAETNKK